MAPRPLAVKDLYAYSQPISRGFNEIRSSEAHLGLRVAASALGFGAGFDAFPFLSYFLLLLSLLLFSTPGKTFPAREGLVDRLIACVGERKAATPRHPPTPHPPPANHPITSPISGIMTAKEGGNRPESVRIRAAINSR